MQLIPISDQSFPHDSLSMYLCKALFLDPPDFWPQVHSIYARDLRVVGLRL